MHIFGFLTLISFLSAGVYFFNLRVHLRVYLRVLVCCQDAVRVAFFFDFLDNFALAADLLLILSYDFVL